MLGTKIIEDYSIIEPVDPGTPVPARGLTVRPSKASGLRIVTAHEIGRDQPLRVPHDKHLLHSTSSLMASLITPTSTHTFGVPDPTWKRRPVSSVVSLSLSFEDRESRRISRYSREEGALKSALQSCTAEPADRDLQIRALEKAISLLKAHAADAHERANMLRDMLSDRDLAPDEYASLQKERWMQEHRSQARLEEAKALQGMLTQLKASAPLLVDPPVSNGSKLHTNLLQFFTNSPTKVSLNSSLRQWDETIFRHRTISDVRSLRLRSTAVVSALKRPIGRRVRSKSLGQKALAYRPGDMPLRRGVGTACDAATPANVQPTQALAPTTMSARVTSPTVSMFQTPGFATILAPAGPRTREELAANLTNVSLPSYAQELMDEFDDIDGDIHLTNLAFQRARSSVKRVPVPARPETPPTPPLPVKFDDPSHRERSASLPRLNDTLRTKADPNASIRRPISMLFPPIKTKGSLDSDSRPSSSFADRDDMENGGRRADMQTPTESNRNRWSLPSGGPKVKSPSKVFSRMKSKFSLPLRARK